jgi:hypothetical protein
MFQGTEPCLTGGLGEICEQFSWRHRERTGQLDDVLQGHVPLPSLHPAHVIPVQPCPFGQFLLRISAFVAELSQ